MEILLAFLFGTAYGAVLHYLMPGRTSRGGVLAPILGTVTGGAAWLALTWAGLDTTSPWLWLVSIAVPVAVVPVTLTILTRTRAAHDTRERVRMRIA
ncbi:hypothetical protein [Microbacterium sp.]|uniref:hypothetical protein n=1 Tax=Microbacterium sp. TaxID=51671 RepID=UPI003C743BDD